MSLKQAYKVVIITEKILIAGIRDLIEEHGVSGYSIIPTDGKGSRNIRTTFHSASVVDGFVNVKIEVVVNSVELAETLMKDVADAYFDSYSGITYLEEVKVLRSEKFGIA